MMPAKSLVQESFEKRFEFHPSGEFLWFPKPCPWKEILHQIEKEKELEGIIKFVFYQDERGMYRVQAVSDDSF